jgi:rubrerythrin
MTQSEQFLLEAFAGESQANRRYLAFAKQAEEEGYHQVAKLFRAVAEAETVHALAHLRALKGVKSTAENLREAISGETHEFKIMYPAMVGTAILEGNKEAERSFKYANEVEKVHAELFERALANLDKQVEADYCVCSVCGNTCENEHPENCQVCGNRAEQFFMVGGASGKIPKGKGKVPGGQNSPPDRGRGGSVLP